MDDQKTTEQDPNETPEAESPADLPELFSREFFKIFSVKSDWQFWQMFMKAGLKINDDGSHKFVRPMNKRELEELLTAWHEGLVTKDELRDYVQGLGTGKVTRYRISSDLAARRRAAGQGKE